MSADQPDLSNYATLQPEAIAWLANGRRGDSSNTLISAMYGITAISVDNRNAPKDPADLRRCRLMVDSIPGGREKLLSIVDIQAPALRRVALLNTVEHWDVLCAVMDSEVPDYRDPAGHPAERTYAALQLLVWDAAYSAMDSVPHDIQLLRIGNDKTDPARAATRSLAPESLRARVDAMLMCPILDKRIPGRAAYELLEQARVTLRFLAFTEDKLSVVKGAAKALERYSHVTVIPKGQKQEQDARYGLYLASKFLWETEVGNSKVAKVAGEALADITRKFDSAIQMAVALQAEKAEKKAAAQKRALSPS